MCVCVRVNAHHIRGSEGGDDIFELNSIQAGNDMCCETVKLLCYLSTLKYKQTIKVGSEEDVEMEEA